MFPLQALIKKIMIEMKRIVLPIAGALLLTACADQQSREPRPDTAAIGFATSVTRSATGPVSGFTAGDSFDVWAQFSFNGSATANTVFDGEEVSTADGSAWTYSNTRYWESDAEYRFAAIFPAGLEGASVTFDASGNPVFRIDNYNATANYDLMTAGPQTVVTTAGNPGPVQLQFEHIMSNIVFEARTAPVLIQNGVTMTITSFKLTGFPVTASFNSAATPHWSVSTPENERYNFSGEIALTTDEYTELADLIVFPQELGTVEGSSLQYSISYRSSTGVEYNRSGRLNAVSGDLARWQEGMRYRYSIELGADYILFGRPEVEEWNETSGGRWTVE